jgi:alkylhydroperoxidase family enzyme
MASSWLASAESSDLASLLALRPELAELRTTLLDRLWVERLVDPVVLELCRLRIAMLLDDHEALAIRTPHAIAAGLSEQQMASLGKWPTDPQFTPAQRAALTAAEQFLFDARAIDSKALGQHFNANERYAMLIGFAMFDGFGRMRRVLTDPVTDERD